jgi:Kef-type K+ transport system membrane component KefB
MPDLVKLLLQISAIVVCARLTGLAFRRIGQPQVMGEMVAGIMLGPSFLGWLYPEAMQKLFPEDSLGYLSTLSQVGLLLYMFLVGLEFNPKLLRNMGHAAFLTSHVSISIPFLLGAVLALYLYPLLSSNGVPFQEFALFMGAAMSVTAFPVLARILRERELHRTQLGAVSIACAAVDDATAWCILAYILALVRSSHSTLPLSWTVLGLVVFVLFMVLAVKKWLLLFERRFRTRGSLSDDMIGLILLILLGSATMTEWLGIHLLFGAFLFGAIMPKSEDFVARISEKIESVTMVLLLPIFFAFTGLRTSTGLLHEPEMWMFCGLIILVAVAGKLGGSFFAARIAGLPWRDAAGVGILMNTRGLMELVILNIGLDLGIISPAVFSMMVVMALVTTFMTTPLLAWVYPRRLILAASAPQAVEGKWSYPAEPFQAERRRVSQSKL